MQSIDRFTQWLEGVMNYELGKVGETSITLSGMVTLLLMFTAVIALEVFVRRYFIMRLLKRTQLEHALQYAIARIAGYLVLALGFYVALQAVGIDLSSLAIVAGAVGVGLGFGLQNIINNFVSGLIILAERPIAIGDRVEVGGVAGQVVRISLRSTTVLTNDNISIIVPNGHFISEVVTNWSHGDPKVLSDPAPDLFFKGFGDSSLDFELVVWSAEMTFKPRRFYSELNYAIEARLRQCNIEIPFPQRDLHLRSGPWSRAAEQDGN